MPHLLTRSSRALAVLALATGLSAATVNAADAAPKKGAKAARTAPKADLVTKGLFVDFADDVFTVEARVANIGNRKARGSDLTIAVSTDKVLDDEDEFLDEIAVPRVKAHAERQISTEVELPADLSDGDLYLLVCADGNEDVAERREDNNCVAQEITSAGDQTDPGDDPASDDSSDDDGGETADVPVTIE